jgi:hypothetical protein
VGKAHAGTTIAAAMLARDFQPIKSNPELIA